MSVTTTASTTTQTVLKLLADYEVTHSEDNSTLDPQTATLNARDGSSENSNPDWWPTDYNDIPPHRPIDYHLDREQRPWGNNGAETVFVSVMLNGLGLNAWAARSWRRTFGKVWDIRYSIGGER